MSDHHNPEQFADDVEPACIDEMIKPADWWNEDPASAYPPGYAPLCTNDACFPDADPDEDGRDPDYDHRADAEMVVRGVNSSARPRTLHRKKGEQ